ncbi:MAG: hypothetical protein ACKO5R_16205 [Planctomycetaceae bacterium]
MSDVRREPRRPLTADDESLTSELVIGADGRVHVFGTSLAILEALDAIGVRGDAVRARLAASSATVAAPATAAGGS